MKVVQVPVWSDNYSYIIIDEETRSAAVVDPAQPKKVLEAAMRENVSVSMVLTTHHHWDHAGGNKEFASLVSPLEIVGGDDRIPALTKLLKHDDTFKIGNLNVRVLFTPCHTTGHVLYYVTGKDCKALFSGDTLFIGGCGRFFEGTAQQMYDAICKIVPSLPHDTRIFCGHEYTVKNLEFALTIEPNNKALVDKLQWARDQRSQDLSTVPSIIAEELTYNPFMRVNEPSVQRAVGKENGIDVMAELRDMKNHFV